jgi:hypothetical protein
VIPFPFDMSGMTVVVTGSTRGIETNFFSNEQLGGHGVGISSEDLLRTLIDHHHHGWKNCPVGLGIPCKIYGKRALPMRHSPKNFLASKEVAIHPHYRERLLRATEDDTVYLEELFDIGWPKAPHRVLRNSTVTAWEAAGRPGQATW